MIGRRYPNMTVIISSAVLSVNKTNIFIARSNFLMYSTRIINIFHIGFWIWDVNVLKQEFAGNYHFLIFI